MLHGTRVPGAGAADGGRPDATGPRGLGGAAAATFVLLWSSGAIAVSIGLGETDAVTFLALRALGAAMVSWLVWLVVRVLYTMVTRAETVRVTSLFYCVPPVTAALDYLVFRTLLGPAELLGMALVVIALVLIQATPPENRLPRSATSRPGNIDARPSPTRTGRV